MATSSCSSVCLCEACLAQSLTQALHSMQCCRLHTFGSPHAHMQTPCQGLRRGKEPTWMHLEVFFCLARSRNSSHRLSTCSSQKWAAVSQVYATSSATFNWRASFSTCSQEHLRNYSLEPEQRQGAAKRVRLPHRCMPHPLPHSPPAVKNTLVKRPSSARAAAAAVNRVCQSHRCGPDPLAHSTAELEPPPAVKNTLKTVVLSQSSNSCSQNNVAVSQVWARPFGTFNPMR